MQILKFNLRETPTEHGFMPTMEVYLIDKFRDTPRPTAVIFPGGGYGFVCDDREGERIALNYNAAGYHAAVVKYAVSPHKAHEPLREAAEALRIIRAHSEEWQADLNKIAVCGFSAGGHLAASLSTLWNCPEVFTKEEIDSRLHRPDASVLCYPVITSGKYAHRGSFDNLTGGDEGLLKLYSVENQVNADTPPAFLWHTFEDNAVPVENSLLYASALGQNGVQFELHVYPRGGHGMSLVTDETIWSKPLLNRDYGWLKLSVEFLNEQFGI